RSLSRFRRCGALDGRRFRPRMYHRAAWDLLGRWRQWGESLEAGVVRTWTGEVRTTARFVRSALRSPRNRVDRRVCPGGSERGATHAATLASHRGGARRRRTDRGPGGRNPRLRDPTGGSGRDGRLRRGPGVRGRPEGRLRAGRGGGRRPRLGAEERVVPGVALGRPRRIAEHLRRIRADAS